MQLLQQELDIGEMAGQLLLPLLLMVLGQGLLQQRVRSIARELLVRLPLLMG